MKQTFIFALIFSVTFSPGLFVSVHAQENVSNDWKLTTAGKVRQLIVNRGRFSENANNAGYPGLIGCEYPPNSMEEHIHGTGIWFGGVNTEGERLVSVGAGNNSSDELWPTEAPWDTVWVVNKGDTVDIGGVDEDGNDDYYWPGYTAVSDQDLISRYNDYKILDPSLGGSGADPHTPMYLEVIETVYTWANPPLDEIIIYTFHVIPQRFEIQEVYIAWQNVGRIGNINQNPRADDRSLYFPDRSMLAFEDGPGGTDGDAIGAVGFRYFLPDGLERTDVNWTYTHGSNEMAKGLDEDRYNSMSSGMVMENQQAYDGVMANLSVGPFDIPLGDTLTFRIAQILGEGLEGVLENSATVAGLVEHDFRVPSAPPSPTVEVETSSKEVHLSWHPTEENNPEDYQDPNRADGAEQPFEGYKIYKSTQSPDGPWKPLYIADISGNEYGPNTGLTYEYTDTGLLNNTEYYYSVTTFSKPDTAFPWPQMESSVYANQITAVPGPASPETVGEVAVVPNPYRGDIAYHEYDPPWEKSPRGRSWMEQDRKIQFINLPARCEIKIYTPAGDYIKTIKHDDPNKGYEDWNLTSYVEQAIASGLYVYTVEDLNTGKIQVGKFVIIK